VKKFWLVIFAALIFAFGFLFRQDIRTCPLSPTTSNFEESTFEITSEETTEPNTGDYSADRPLTDEDLAVFEEVMNSWDGAVYAPTLVATQVVAGTNYRFTATATGVCPDAEPHEVYVYIFLPLDGPAELVEIVNAAD